MSALSLPRRRAAGVGARTTIPAGPDGWVPLVPTRTRVTRRALIQGLLGVVLYGAGANVSAGWVVALSAIVIGSLPWAWWSARRAVRTLAVRRELPPTVTAGRPTAVSLEVRAHTAAMAVVADDLTDTVGVATGLGSGARLTATVTLDRGRGVAGEVRVALSDAFGLVTVHAAGVVGSTTEVLPAVPTVRRPAHRAAWAVEAGGDARRPGDGVDVLGVREYRRGDALRAVAWRASARRDQLVVRELEDPARPRVRVDVAPGPWEPRTLDRALEVVCGVADDAARAGHPTEVAVDGTAGPWSPSLRRLLAAVPPHAGAPARALALVPPGIADLTIEVAPVADGVAVTRVSDGDRTPLGVVAADATLTDVEAWLDRQLAARP
ncbi:MAG: DUF58 domain-containing protein [Actinobacteria bacterium]|nr:DUF58 domain-containing protein [Actinomycetota bacterium]